MHRVNRERWRGDEVNIQELNEAELYLRLQIDPRDSHNPKYDLIHRQLDAITAAKVQIALWQPVTVVIPRSTVPTTAG